MMDNKYIKMSLYSKETMGSDWTTDNEHICQRRQRNGRPPRDFTVLSKIFSCFVDTAEPDATGYNKRNDTYSDDTVLVNVSKILQNPIHYNIDHIPKSRRQP